MRLGIHIIPQMPAKEVIETIRAAETLGYDYALVCDEGFMPDPYIVLGAAAYQTSRIRLGLVTNGYTRHPAVTASSLTTLNQVSGGRAMVTLVAGGSMVLNPMAIAREEPHTVVSETIDILRRLWTGEVVNYDGKRYRLKNAQISLPCQDIPIWLAVRGPKMLELAGQKADGVLLMVKADLGPALELVEKGSVMGRKIQRIYLDRIAYDSESINQASVLYTFVIMDSPDRQLKSLGLSEEMIAKIRQAMQTGGPEAASKFVTLDMIKQYQITGSPEECTQMVRQLSHQFNLDVFLFNMTSGGLEKNIQQMRDVRSIVLGSERR